MKYSELIDIAEGRNEDCTISETIVARMVKDLGLEGAKNEIAGLKKDFVFDYLTPLYKDLDRVFDEITLPSRGLLIDHFVSWDGKEGPTATVIAGYYLSTFDSTEATHMLKMCIEVQYPSVTSWSAMQVREALKMVDHVVNN